MYFRQILHESRSCASYLVGCSSLGSCAVVDPQGDVARYIEAAEENAMVVQTVIDTHLHADHPSSARELASATGATLYLGPNADVRFEHATLNDGDVITVGNRRIEVLHTPGHTPEHICLWVDEWFVLTGDTLFVGDVGRIDLAEGESTPVSLSQRATQLRRSLQRLLALPEWTEIYPGHYAGSACGKGMDGKTITTIGRERRKNRMLRLEPDDLHAMLTSNPPPAPDDFRWIKRANAGIADKVGDA